MDPPELGTRAARGFSPPTAHPALVSDADFLATQAITAVPVPRNGATHRYRLTGLLICSNCGRRLEGHWVHGRAGYRCRHGHTSARPRNEQVHSVYWAERRILDQLLYSLSYQGQLPLFAGIDDLLNHLQTHDLLIVCDAATLNLEITKSHHDHPSMG